MDEAGENISTQVIGSQDKKSLPIVVPKGGKAERVGVDVNGVMGSQPGSRDSYHSKDKDDESSHQSVSVLGELDKECGRE